MKKKGTMKTDGKEHHAGFLIRRIDTKSGIRYQVDFGKRNGKYERKSFHTLAEARGCANNRRLQLDQHGQKALTISEEQRVDAIAAIERLNEYGVTLQAAAEFYAKHHQQVDQTNGIAPLVERFIKEQAQKVESGKMRPMTYSAFPVRLKPLKEKLGHLAVNAVRAEDIQGLLVGYKPQNAANYKRYTSIFFEWAVKQDLIDSNPVKKVERIQLDNNTPPIYTPDETEAIMRAFMKPDARKEMLPYFALAFFAGVRPEEICRLDWEYIDLTDGTIHIRAEVSKTHNARIIEMPDNLRQWLALCPNKSGLVFPYCSTSLQRWRTQMHKIAGVNVIQDGARHSMATYYLAAGHTADETTDMLGHSTEVLYKHYKGLMKGKKQKAKAYFSIRP